MTLEALQGAPLQQRILMDPSLSGRRGLDPQLGGHLRADEWRLEMVQYKEAQYGERKCNKVDSERAKFYRYLSVSGCSSAVVLTPSVLSGCLKQAHFDARIENLHVGCP